MAFTRKLPRTWTVLAPSELPDSRLPWVAMAGALAPPIAAIIGARATLIAVTCAGVLTTLGPLFLGGVCDVEGAGLAFEGADIRIGAAGSST
jgi:hypothetical protein